MLRIVILIGAVIGSNLLMGQSQSALSAYDTVVKVSLLSNGEFKLKRLRATSLVYNFTHPGETFMVSVRNQEGLNFKKVGWEIDKKKKHILKKQAEFKDQISSTPGKSFKLCIKPSLSFHRQVAYVQVLIQTIDSIKHIPQPPINGAQQKILDSLYQKRLDSLADHENALLLARLKDSSSGLITEELKSVVGDQPLISIQSKKKLEPEQLPGQRSSLSPSGIQLLPRTGKPRAFEYRDFQRGDTLLFSVTAKKSPLKAIWLTRNKDTLINRVVDALTFADTVVIQNEQLIILHLEGYFSLKENAATISVIRIRPVKPDSVAYLVNYSISKKDTASFDTILFTVIDQTLSLSPIREIEREPFAQVEVQIPASLGEGYSLTKAAYWLGIGRDCLNNFLSLEASVPPSWSKPGASPVMGALVLSRSLVLPPIGAVDVISRFSNRPIAVNQQGQKINLSSNLPRGQNAGLLTLKEIKALCFKGKSLATNSPSYIFFACFQNKNTAIPYPIQLKVVGSYQKRTPVPAQLVSKGAKSIKLPIEQ